MSLNDNNKQQRVRQIYATGARFIACKSQSNREIKHHSTKLNISCTLEDYPDIPISYCWLFNVIFLYIHHICLHIGHEMKH